MYSQDKESKPNNWQNSGQDCQLNNGVAATVWTGQQSKAYGRMLWAAACTGFFEFLRVGEVTVLSIDPQLHLSLVDIAIDTE